MRLVRARILGPLIGAILLAVAPGLSAAEEEPDFLALSVGAFDFDDDDTSAEFRAEYRSDLRFWIFTPFLGLMFNSDGGVYGYGGLGLDIFLGRRFVATPNAAFGAYAKGDSKNLGSTLEFRTGIELAYRLDDRSRVGVAINHTSNASIDDRNPGANSLVLTYAIRFDSLY